MIVQWTRFWYSTVVVYGSVTVAEPNRLLLRFVVINNLMIVYGPTIQGKANHSNEYYYKRVACGPATYTIVNCSKIAEFNSIVAIIKVAMSMVPHCN